MELVNPDIVLDFIIFYIFVIYSIEKGIFVCIFLNPKFFIFMISINPIIYFNFLFRKNYSITNFISLKKKYLYFLDFLQNQKNNIKNFNTYLKSYTIKNYQNYICNIYIFKLIIIFFTFFLNFNY